jgi:AAA+ ATPase superfamily predicted ATPase
MFIGRQRELKSLNEKYKNGQFEFAVIYGRRRVGKTTLINEFIKDKETIIYSGIETNAKNNLESLSKSIYSLSEDFSNTKGSFSSFQEALETVFKIAEKRRIVFVMDEYPYVAGSYKALSSILQLLIDKNKDTSKLFLILCGSSMSFMEYQVLGYISPLFGRRTCQYKIMPFEFVEMKNYYKKFSDTELATIYGITGGIPLYLSLMNENLSVEDNIRHNFLTPNEYLFEEPTNLIKQECRDPSQYNSIIKAIATGSTRLSEICSKTGLDTALATSYINKLIGLGIVNKEKPYGENGTRKPIYVLEDSMFRFWYRFIPDNLAAIIRGHDELAYKNIKPEINSFMGAVFEKICSQYMWQLNLDKNSPVDFNDIGRWWGNDPINKCETEIDLMAAAANNSAIFCECKWTKNKTDTSVLDDLFAQSKLFHYNPVQLYLFSKSGFTKGCIESAVKMGNVHLITFAEMFT